MSDTDSKERDDTTSKETIFGSVERGTICLLCGRNVDDGRRIYCSERCEDIAKAVLRMLNWWGVKERVKERDDYTCQRCGVDAKRRSRAIGHIRWRVSQLTEELKPDRLSGDYESSIRYNRARRQLEERYNFDKINGVGLEVDHMQRVADGGAMFDESNLQTLCTDCHQKKTVAENSGWGEHPEELETLTLEDYLTHE